MNALCVSVFLLSFQILLKKDQKQKQKMDQYNNLSKHFLLVKVKVVDRGVIAETSIKMIQIYKHQKKKNIACHS